MARAGAEPIRRAAIVKATIQEVGRAGSLEITVAQIAARAGMSSALAHHYFGSKEAIFVAAMRHVLTLFGAEVRGALAAADDGHGARCLAGREDLVDMRGVLRAVDHSGVGGGDFFRDAGAASGGDHDVLAAGHGLAASCSVG